MRAYDRTTNRADIRILTLPELTKAENFQSILDAGIGGFTHDATLNVIEPAQALDLDPSSQFYLLTGGLQFPLQRDEERYWGEVPAFSGQQTVFVVAATPAPNLHPEWQSAAVVGRTIDRQGPMPMLTGAGGTAP